MNVENTNFAGTCKQQFVLHGAVLHVFGSVDNFRDALIEDQNAINVVGITAAASVYNQCKGCIFMDTKLGNQRAQPTIPSVQIQVRENTISTFMSCDRMMSEQCLQKGDKTPTS